MTAGPYAPTSQTLTTTAAIAGPSRPGRWLGHLPTVTIRWLKTNGNQQIQLTAYASST
jgi:hypothetical protein